MAIKKLELQQVMKMFDVGRNTISKELNVSDNQAKILVSIRDNLPVIASVIESQKLDLLLLKQDEIAALKKFRKEKTVRNILVVGDLHAPFTLEGYLDFCKEMYLKYNCTEVVFIGDILDMHFSSFHEIDADGHSAGKELALAKAQIKLWYEAFPVAKVCLGNHDLIPNRKAMTAGLSKAWIKNIGDVIDTPNWEYAEDFLIDNVLYTHGTGRKARQRAKADLISVVQGHYHSEGYIENFVGMNYKIFAMQVGAGLDKNSYAAAYGKHFNKPHICCGLVLENGKLPILEYMDL